MLDNTVQEFDPFAAASNPPEQTYDLFGKVDVLAYACGLKKDLPAYDPAVHDKRYTAIKIYLQPLAEIDAKYPKMWESSWVSEFPTWAKITWKSIRDCGIDNLREINGKWARVARVDSLEKPFEKKDAQGNPTGEMAVKKTFKFIQFFDTEDECRAAYVAAGGQPANGGNGHNNPQPVGEDPEKTTAHAFLKVIVSNAVRGHTDWNQAKEAVAKALAQYPTVAKFYTVDSEEVSNLMAESNDAIMPF